jgi:hypothetical protein
MDLKKLLIILAIIALVIVIVILCVSFINVDVKEAFGSYA